MTIGKETRAPISELQVMAADPTLTYLFDLLDRQDLQSKFEQKAQR